MDAEFTPTMTAANTVVIAAQYDTSCMCKSYI